MKSKSNEMDLRVNFSELLFRLTSLSEQHFFLVVSFLEQHFFSDAEGILQTSSDENTEETAAIFSPQ